MQRGKSHGEMTREPIGFDYVSFTVESKEALFALKDKIDAAGFEVSGAVDHCTMWLIYFFDPNNIPLEVSWDCMEILKAPDIEDDDPMPVAAEGAGPKPSHWPEVVSPTPASGMFAHAGNGKAMRESFLKQGLAGMLPGFDEPAVGEAAE